MAVFAVAARTHTCNPTICAFACGGSARKYTAFPAHGLTPSPAACFCDALRTFAKIQTFDSAFPVSLLTRPWGMSWPTHVILSVHVAKVSFPPPGLASMARAVEESNLRELP